MNKKGFWIALLLGAAGGSLAALLFAPQTGVKTRKQLKRNLSDAGDTLEEAGDYLRKQAERLTKEADNLLDISKDRADSAYDSAAKYVRSARRSVAKLV